MELRSAACIAFECKHVVQNQCAVASVVEQFAGLTAVFASCGRTVEGLSRDTKAHGAWRMAFSGLPAGCLLRGVMALSTARLVTQNRKMIDIE
jgi:hypothetical protein